MENESVLFKKTYSREYFTKLVDDLRSDEDIADLITLYSTLSGDELELATPSFCLLAEKCSASMQKQMMDIVHYTLTELKSRSARKAALACLKVLTRGEESIWSDFFIICQCLEEPQFHLINPVLPLLHNVLQLVYSDLFDFKWAMVIFMRAFAHSNGWVRLWALEKLLTIQPVTMAANYEFFLSVILNHLNSNEPFWRLLHRGNLVSFLDALRDLVVGMMSSLNDSSRELFLLKTLRTLTQMSSPSSIFFISHSLMKIPASRCLHLGDLPLVITLLQKTRYIQHTALRLAALFNFVVLFSKVTGSDPDVANKVGSLTAFFSREDPFLLNHFIDMESSQSLLRSMFEPLEAVQLLLQSPPNFEKDDFAALFWVRVRLSGQEDKVKKVIELELADRLVAVEEKVDVGFSSSIVEAVDTLLTILFAYKEELLPLGYGLSQLIHGYILLRCAVANPTESERFIIHNVYVGLLRRLKLSLKSVVDLSLSLISEKDIPIGRHALLIKILHDAFDHLSHEEVEDAVPGIVRYLGENPLVPVKHPESVVFLREKDTNKLSFIVHEYRLKLVIKLLPNIIHMNPEQTILECVDRLACASTYPVAQCYLEISEIFIDKVKCSNTLLELVKASIVFTKQEKKSHNFLRALRCMLRLCFKMSVMNDRNVAPIFVSYCFDLLTVSQLNTQVALYLSEALLDAEKSNLLSKEWMAMVFALAVFGPIPKKEDRVVSAACEMIYRDRPNRLEDSHEPFEVIQRTRLNGISIALHLSQRDPEIMSHIVEHIIAEINAMNQNSSRSFGLSFAHRHNTRAASLLLLLVDHLYEEDVLDKVFDNCVDWIADPCQQFSIKLLLEWLLVRLAVRSHKYRVRVVDLERIFANKRTGSVCSWINMLVLLSRSEEDEFLLDLYLEKVLPWTTAQNFSVRCTAVAAVRLLYNMIPINALSKWKLVKRVVEFDGECTGNSQRIICDLVKDFYFGHLNPLKHFDLQTILLELPKKTGMPPEETIPVNLIKKFNSSSISSTNEDEQFLSAPSQVYSRLSKSNSCSPEIAVEEDETYMDNAGPTLVQRKVVTEEKIIRKDHGLIVVASLVDKPTNLGGLCRTCEIFGVDTLVIADHVYLSDPSFKALSLFSEKRQHIEVRPEHLLSYLENMRKDGYTVIAAEQTTDSVFLHKFQFPLKTVLLVGDEKEGVPVHLLRCVDQTVEIKQLGQTRSLNVHVSAALFLAKYAEQVLFS